jgi:hypothetical protein
MSQITLPTFPKSLEKWGRCLLLHKHYPVYDATTNRIIHICKECQNDNDTTEDKEATQPS